MAVQQLAQLAEEPWGARLRRARISTGLTLQQVADLVSEAVPTSHATLSRLEGFDEAPLDIRRRVVATLALVIAGYDEVEHERVELPLSLLDASQLGEALLWAADL